MKKVVLTEVGLHFQKPLNSRHHRNLGPFTALSSFLTISKDLGSPYQPRTGYASAIHSNRLLQLITSELQYISLYVKSVYVYYQHMDSSRGKLTSCSSHFLQFLGKKRGENSFYSPFLYRQKS